MSLLLSSYGKKVQLITKNNQQMREMINLDFDDFSERDNQAFEVGGEKNKHG